MSVVSPPTRLPSITRHGFDRCPGALKPFDATDGKIARVRLAGQPLTAPQLRALTRLATDVGDGHVWFTSRANVQLRALDDDGVTEFAHTAAERGLLPSVTHERSRNIVISPRSPHGLHVTGPHPEELARLLDRAICAEPELARLPGRFLIGIDDGSGDVATLPLDVVVQACSGRWVARLGSNAEDVVDLADANDAAAAALILSRVLLVWTEGAHGRASTSWNISDLSDAEYRAFMAAVRRVAKSSKHRVHVARTTRAPLGVCELSTGAAVGAGATLGCVSASAWEVLTELAESITDARVRVTPWHSVVVVGLTADQAQVVVRRLAQAGWVTESSSPAAHVHACTGTPGCVRSLGDVRAAARATMEAFAATKHVPERPVYWAGCERRCGHPSVPHDMVLAQGVGLYSWVQHDGSHGVEAQAQATGITPEAVIGRLSSS